jgi:hypothetical protein
MDDKRKGYGMAKRVVRKADKDEDETFTDDTLLDWAERVEQDMNDLFQACAKSGVTLDVKASDLLQYGNTGNFYRTVTFKLAKKLN